MTSGARCRGVRRGCKEGSPVGLGGGGAPSRARAVCRTATGRCAGHDSIPRATGRMCSGRALLERISGLRLMPPPARGLLSPPSPRSCRRHAPLPIVDPHRTDAWRSGQHPGAGRLVVTGADLRMMSAGGRAGTATGWTAGKEDGRLERLHESRSLSPGDPLRPAVEPPGSSGSHAEVCRCAPGCGTLPVYLAVVVNWAPLRLPEGGPRRVRRRPVSRR